MKKIFKDLAGGLAIIVVAAVLGLAHNAVRGNSLDLIPGASSQPEPKPAPKPNEGGVVQDAVSQAMEDAIREGEVTVDQLKTIMDDPTVMVVDARSPEEFDAGRIAGAINVPYDRMPDYYQSLIERVPMDVMVVVYCQGPDCDFSHQLATELRIMGYVTVVLFPGGWEHWEAAGYPIESKKADI